MGFSQTEPQGRAPSTALHCGHTEDHQVMREVDPGAGRSSSGERLLGHPTYPGGMVGWALSRTLSPHPLHCRTPFVRPTFSSFNHFGKKGVHQAALLPVMTQQ